MLSASLAPAEKQAQEREALQAIFADDFESSLTANAFRICLRANPLSASLAFAMPHMYPLEPVVVAVEECMGLTPDEEAALRAAVTSKANSPDLEGQLAVFAVAQEAQDWMNACVEARAAGKKKKHPAKAGDSRGAIANSGSAASSTDDAEKELEKRIADDLKRKRELLLKTPEADWMNEVPPDDASSGSSRDEDDIDSLEDEDNMAVDASTTSSSDRHAFAAPSKRPESSSSHPNLSSRVVSPQPTSPLRQSAPTLTPPPGAAASAASPSAHKLRWKLGQVLSEGACVRFFQAMNLESGSTMAVRQTTFPAALPPAKAEAIEKTLRYVQRLSSPALVPCKGYEWLPGATSINVFLPDLRGGSLESLVRSFGPIPELSIVRKYAKQVVLALQFLHERGVFHNNVTPKTVFLDHRGNLRLADYGISPVKMDEEWSNEALIRHDVLSMGTTVMFCVTGAECLAVPSQWPPIMSEEAIDFVASAVQAETSRPSSLTFFVSHPFVCSESTSSIAGFVASTPPSMGVGIPLTSFQHKTNMASNEALWEYYETAEQNLTGSNAASSPHMRGLMSQSQESQATHGNSGADDNSQPHSSESYISGPTASASRYRTDFEELEMIGHGGFGEVIRVKNRLDGRLYAVKKVLLDSWDQKANGKILREVTTLSRLHHQHVVRYFQAWIEGTEQEEIEALLARAQEHEGEDVHTSSGSESASPEIGRKAKGQGLGQKLIKEESSSSGSDGGGSDDSENNDEDDEKAATDELEKSTDWLSTRSGIVFEKGSDEEDAKDSPKAAERAKTAARQGPRHQLCLYIQMEYCEKNTLHQLIKNAALEEEERWRLFRQILEGLNNIHHQGIIHRDLKPSNIFISRDGNVKIGDFGLATEGGGASEARSIMSVSMDNSKMQEADLGDEDMTKGVGTPFYISPEQLRVGGSYNRKVDMYALGIMLFEMCYSSTTLMERHRVLGALRENLTFPAGMEARLPTECAVIRWLLNPDPKKRPTARQLLESELLPSNLDQEIVKEALRTIHPESTIYGDLMKRLFAREPDPRVDYTYDFNSSEQPFLLEGQVATMAVTDSFVDLARRHGAIRFDGMLLMPKRTPVLSDVSACAQLLDEGGLPVVLPYDLTLPFARFVSLNKIARLKRFSVARVFRKNAAGGQPRALLECDFDIVGPPIEAAEQEAETISFLLEFLESFSLGPELACTVVVNHSGAIDAALKHCNVQPAHYVAARKMFSRASRFSVERIAQRIAQDFGLSEHFSSLLASTMSLRGPFGQTVARFRTLYSTDQRALEVCKHLKRVQLYCTALGIESRLRFDLSAQINATRYDGLVFAANLDKQRQVVAVGGRYDALLRTFRNQSETGAVGVSIALEKVVQVYLSILKSGPGKMSAGLHRASEAEVLVSSVGETPEAPLEERMAMCRDLWSWGYRADFAQVEQHHSPEDVIRGAAKGTHAVLFLRRAGIVRLALMSDRSSVELKRSEVKEFLREAVPIPWQRQRALHAAIAYGAENDTASSASTRAQPRRKDSSDDSFSATSAFSGGSNSSVSAAAAPAVAAGACYHLLLDVVILDEIKGRKAKVIQDTVTKRLTGQLSNLASRKPVSVACIDLPIGVLSEIAMLSDEKNVHAPFQKHMRHKEAINALVTFVKKTVQRKVHCFMVLWSTRDDQWRIMNLPIN